MIGTDSGTVYATPADQKRPDQRFLTGIGALMPTLRF